MRNFPQIERRPRRASGGGFVFMSATGNLNPMELARDAVVTDARLETSVGLVVDEDARIRHFLSLILYGAGVDAIEYAGTQALRSNPQIPASEIIFLGVGYDTDDSVQTLKTLARRGYAGAVQLIGVQSPAALENLKRIGAENNLRMLRPLRKPVDGETIKKILQAEKLGDRTATGERVSLQEALKNGWIETWYQPKINLRKKQLAGCEAFARVRHPTYGVLSPSAFMPGADEMSLLALAEHSLIKALKAGMEFSALGINLRIAVNMSLEALAKVPVADIVRSYRPQSGGWAGLVIDVTEEQIVNDIGRAAEIAKRLVGWNVKLAIDDFGRGVSSLLKVREIPFAEMKLDRVFVTGCSADKVNASICKSVIDLAHSFGSLAVGVGVETAADVAALVEMGCDLGQGFLLGQPMAEARFAALLKQRAASQAATQAVTSPRKR